MTPLAVRVNIAPGLAVQSVTSPTSDSGVASLILAQSHIFVEIEHENNSTLSFVMSIVSLLLSHWYLGSGVVLDCIDS